MQRDLHEEPRGLHARHRLDHGEMAGARDGAELRQPLHQPQQNPLPQRHVTRPATRAIRPTTMAPLRRAMTRSIRPTTSRAAATSTARRATTATSKEAPPYCAW